MGCINLPSFRTNPRIAIAKGGAASGLSPSNANAVSAGVVHSAPPATIESPFNTSRRLMPDTPFHSVIFYNHQPASFGQRNKSIQDKAAELYAPPPLYYAPLNSANLS